MGTALLSQCAWTILLLIVGGAVSCEAVSSRNNGVLWGFPRAMRDFSNGWRRFDVPFHFQQILVEALQDNAPVQTHSSGPRTFVKFSQRGSCLRRKDSSLEDLWKGVLSRVGKMSGSHPNVLMVSFAQWMEGNNDRDTDTTGGRHPFDLGHLYGRSAEEQFAVRTFNDGKLNVDILAARLEQHSSRRADYVPECLGQNTDVMLVGKVFWDAVFIQAHNRWCDKVRFQEPWYSDKDIFDTVQLLMTHTAVKIYLEGYVSDLLLPGRHYVRPLTYQPNVLRSLPRESVVRSSRVESEVVRNWRYFIPKQLGSSLNDSREHKECVLALHGWNSKTLSNTASILANTPLSMGNVTASARVDILQLLERSRKAKLHSYNDYRARYGLPRFESFSDFGLGGPVTEELAGMYRDKIDSVDLLVGLLLERPVHIEGGYRGDLGSVMLSAASLELVLNSDVVRDASLYTPRALTKTGQQFLDRLTVEGFLEDTTGVAFDCAFWEAGKCPWSLPSVGFGEQLFPYLSVDNIADFTGMDFTTRFLDEEASFYKVVAVPFIVLGGLLALFFHLTHKFWLKTSSSYRELNGRLRIRVCHKTGFMLVYFITFIPYTDLIVRILFSDDCIRTFMANKEKVFWLIVSNAMMYISEGAFVLGQQMTLHHTMWFAFLLLATLKLNVFIVKMCFILDCCARYEFPLFLACIARDLKFPKKFSVRAVLVAIWSFFITRVFQTGLVVWMYTAAWGNLVWDLSTLFATFLVVACTLFQFNSLKLYNKMLKEVERWEVLGKDKP